METRSLSEYNKGNGKEILAMSFFNEKQVRAMLTRNYVCDQCGAKMEFENDWEDILVCPKCGYSVETERYGFESEEDYEALYPTEDEVCGFENEADDEPYEEECDELSHDD